MDKYQSAIDGVAATNGGESHVLRRESVSFLTFALCKCHTKTNSFLNLNALHTKLRSHTKQLPSCRSNGQRSTQKETIAVDVTATVSTRDVIRAVPVHATSCHLTPQIWWVGYQFHELPQVYSILYIHAVMVRTRIQRTHARERTRSRWGLIFFTYFPLRTGRPPEMLS